MSDIALFYPEIFLAIMGFVVLAVGIPVRKSIVNAAITFATLAVAIIMIAFTPYSSAYGITVNKFSEYFAIVLLISALFISLPVAKYLGKRSEIFYSALIFSALGMIFVAETWNLIIAFVAFESVSIMTYIMSAYGGKQRNLEATVKYFFTGTIATTFIILGIAFYFFSVGTFTLSTSTTMVSADKPTMLLALLFLLIGFGFKLAIFPMHQWAIDAYDGTENDVSAFLSTGTKIMAFVIVLKIFLVGFSSYTAPVYFFFVILSVLTMTYANVAALSQNNVKRLLAYSSVAQAGYLILVLAVVSYVGIGNKPSVVDLAIASGMFYSLVYIFMKGGSFLAMNMVKQENVTFDAISGLGKKSPYVAASFSILLLSLAGIPLTGGFLAKYFLFLSVIDGGLWWLAVIAILNSAISVFYYMKVMRYLFWEDPKSEFSTDNGNKAMVIISAAIVVFLGVFYVMFPMLVNISTQLVG
ncbi:NADH dehydrogenase, chain N related protein [Thermoplasma acidophilum]|uniref:NADH dehydrogenase, chain N related protein n=1 Tax=Thermoplasma acidophilum (strain ATCC 25905 / DSM 1728 / JCM 9062 / NBRC 15155 / AMRC-C165) TaxID=273075 RepID=Q9HJK8_THEAC|nr:NADH-quinone oxidoreductase subunit NuoN [Thermoplasma acidophilum]CAC12088.1 NADH dehydrogenase, chain N related protein [Thermoplasma acidophilum]